MGSDSSSSNRSAEQSPFEAEPRPLARPAGGCSRMVLIGCAAAAVLVGVGLLAMMLKARDVVVWSLSSVRSEVEESLPDDLPEEERARLESAFEVALEHLRQGELHPDRFRRLQSALLEFARLNEAPGRDEVRRLTEALEEFASDGETSEPPEPDASESPEGAPPTQDP